jgi:hypothetical protein
MQGRKQGQLARKSLRQARRVARDKVRDGGADECLALFDYCAREWTV